MTRLYYICSIIFRITFVIITVVILFFNILFSDFTGKDDHSLVLPYTFCISCVLIITLFHNLFYPNWLKTILQLISTFLVSYSVFYSILLFEIAQKSGNIFVLIFDLMIPFVGIPLIYFLIRDKKYSRNSHLYKLTKEK